jgi:hypothetical protein
MDQGKLGHVEGLGYEICVGWFEFSPNGSTNPTAASRVGPLARFITSITYSATGVQTIVMTSDFRFAQTPTFLVQAQCESLTEHFHAQQTGSYNTSTRTLVVQQHRNGTGREVAANAAAKVRVYVFAQDTEGK